MTSTDGTSVDHGAARFGQARSGQQDTSVASLGRRFMRLRTILAIAFTVIMIVPLTVLAVWMDRSAYEKERGAVQEKHYLLARYIAADLERYAQDVTSAFEIVRQRRESPILPLALPLALSAHLESLGIRCIFWMRPSDGVIEQQLCSQPGAVSGTLRDAVAQLGDAGARFSSVLPDGAGRPTLYLMQRENDDLVALAAITTDYFVTVHRRIAFGIRGHAAIVDHAGKALAHPSEEVAAQMTSLAQIGPIESLLQGGSGVTEFFSPVKKADMIAGYTAVPSTGWGVMVAQPVAELERRAGSERIVVLFIVLAGLLVAAFAAWLLAGYLTRAITPVVEAAKANAAGHFGTETGPLPRFAPSDLRELASSFNVLAREIRDAYQRQTDALDAVRQAEADYRAIFDNTTEGIFRSTQGGRLLRANPALVAFCGYESEAELITAMNDVTTEWYVDEKRRAEFLADMQEHGRVTNFVSQVYRHRTGEKIWVSENARAVHSDAGKLLYFEGTVLDITEWKRGEEADRRAIEAEAANRTKSEFLAALSHELRTPLNAIIGFSEMMRRGTFGALGSNRYVEYAADIHESGIHLLNLINDLLDLSKIEGKKYQLRDDTIMLNEFVPEVVRLISPETEREQIAIELNLEMGLPALRADSRAMKQMLLNLLSNAVKFSQRGGQVTISARADANGIRLIVEDDGIGIDPANIDKVLTPFGQVEGPAEKRVRGTGLGLSIVKSLIQLHGGDIVIASEPGIGTRVTLTFPATRVLTAKADSPNRRGVAR